MRILTKIPRFPFKILLCSIGLLCAFTSERRQYPAVKIGFKTDIQSYSIDRYDLLYVAETNGDVHKIDTLGNKLLTWSPQKKAELTLMESWRNVNVLLFYRNFQEVIFLDRFLANNSSLKLSQYPSIGFARLATQSSDNNLWVVDEQEFALKKFDLRFNQVSSSTSLDLILDPDQYDLSFVKEYQNQLYLVDRNQGILVFDIMGNYKTKIPTKGIGYTNFINEELYYTLQDTLHFVHLYNFNRRKIPLPITGAKSALVGKNRMYLIFEKEVQLFSRKE